MGRSHGAAGHGARSGHRSGGHGQRNQTGQRSSPSPSPEVSRRNASKKKEGDKGGKDNESKRGSGGKQSGKQSDANREEPDNKKSFLKKIFSCCDGEEGGELRLAN